VYLLVLPVTGHVNERGKGNPRLVSFRDLVWALFKEGDLRFFTGKLVAPEVAPTIGFNGLISVSFIRYYLDV
jgi:hypothetical protein